MPRRIIILMAIAVLPRVAVAQVTVDTRLPDGDPAAIIAHRSAELGGLPENSLAWIDHAIARGIDGVHINPQLTADGAYVLMHDASLNRTTDVEQVFPEGPPGGPDRASRGGKDYVRDYTLDETRRLKLTDGTDGGTHRVPTLDEALALAEGRILVLLGLKTYEPESLLPVLARHGTGNLLVHDLYYGATDPQDLFRLPTGNGLFFSASLSDTQNPLADLDRLSAAIGPSLRMVCATSGRLSPDFVARARALGLAVCVSGWNGREDSALLYDEDPEPWREVLAWGDAALTDLPEAIMEIAGR
jgi:glycerophosphoryl diester phosphodiesterase